MSIPTREELAWAAGLFEGEGSFSLLQANAYPIARAKISMTDRDVIERFRSIIGFGSFFEAPQKNPEHKMQWQWQVASFEGFQAFVAMTYEWLGERRKARATEILLAMHEYHKNRKRPIKARKMK